MREWGVSQPISIPVFASSSDLSLSGVRRLTLFLPSQIADPHDTARLPRSFRGARGAQSPITHAHAQAHAHTLSYLWPLHKLSCGEQHGGAVHEPLRPTAIVMSPDHSISIRSTHGRRSHQDRTEICECYSDCSKVARRDATLQCLFADSLHLYLKLRPSMSTCRLARKLAEPRDLGS